MAELISPDITIKLDASPWGLTMAQPSQPTFSNIWQLETALYLKVTKLKMGKLNILETSKS